MKKLYFFSLAALFVSNIGHAQIAKQYQEKIASTQASEKLGTNFSTSFKAGSNLLVKDAKEIFSQYLQVRTNVDELRFLHTTSVNEMEVHRYQQYFKGIKVEHGNYMLMSKANVVEHIQGDFYSLEENAAVSATLSEEQALQKALSFIGATTYKWQLPAEELQLKKETGNAQATYYPKGELVFVEDFETNKPLDGKVKLAYKFKVYAHEPISHNKIYVDAVTGKILLKDAILKHNKPLKTKPIPAVMDNGKLFTPQDLSPEAIGTAATKYSGTVNIITRQVAGNFRLEATLATEGYPLHTYNCQKGTNYGTAIEFNDADNNWIGFNNANFDDAALDAHWGAGKVYDYWKNIHARNSYNNANAVINSYVHFDNLYDNAFWDGIRMTYGDGSNVAGGFTALTSIDVCSHEIGHAICENTSNLVYQRESGAMNEGFSDIWGAAVEKFADPLEADAAAKSYFLIGEEIAVGGGALRSMSNPKAFGDPDTYGGINWKDVTTTGCVTPSQSGNDFCGVHSNSGLLNYWFYLLVTGKTGINDLGNSYSVPGIGWAKAEKIAYATEVGLTSTGTFANARTVSINAATTLYGGCSLEVEAVTRAWHACAVGTSFVPCSPQIMFGAASQIATETGTTGATCLKTKTITIPVTISSTATQAATVNFTLAGTATQGNNADYFISPSSVTFPAGSTTTQNVTVTINNDTYVEAAETILINLNALTTTGNATKGNVFQQYTVNITDDDYPINAQILSINQTIFSQDFTAATGWISANSTGANSTWRIGNNASTTTYFGASNNCAFVSSNTTGFQYTASTGATQATRLQSPSISTINASNIKLTFDYVCNGELDGGTYYDFGTLQYSIDGGTNWNAINATKYQGTTTKTTITVNLPAGAENAAALMLGFRWDNDNTIQNQPPFGIDNVVLRGDIRTAAPVQTAVNTTTFDEEYLGPNATVNFYDNTTGAVMGTIENLSAHDYGCTRFEVDRAGTSAIAITGDVSGNNKQKLASKTFRVIPTTNNATGNYKITLYYTAAEKTGYETASTRTWVADNGSNNGIRISKFSGAISTLSTANANSVSTKIDAVGTYGTNFTVSATFNSGFSGFGSGIPPSIVLPITNLSFNAKAKANNTALLSWNFTSQQNVNKFILDWSADAINFKEINSIEPNATNNYSFEHKNSSEGKYFYRLKIIEPNGDMSYSQVEQVNFGSKASFSIMPNPVKNSFSVGLNSTEKITSLTITEASGKVVKVLNGPLASNSFKVDVSQLVSGNYIVILQTSTGKLYTEKLVKQ
jgi:Zn-dependent metalloprotease